MSEELNARVAVEVMGWKLCASDSNAPPPYWYRHEDVEFVCNQDKFQPFTSWADAGLVIEEMRRRGYLVRIEDWEEFWEAEFAGPKDSKTFMGKSGFAEASEPLEAICLAALEAVK